MRGRYPGGIQIERRRRGRGWREGCESGKDFREIIGEEMSGRRIGCFINMDAKERKNKRYYQGERGGGGGKNVVRLTDHQRTKRA